MWIAALYQSMGPHTVLIDRYRKARHQQTVKENHTFINLPPFLDHDVPKTNPNTRRRQCRSSSLLTIVIASSTPSFSLGQEGMPATKKNDALMRAMIATCFLLVTIAVIYGGSDSSSSSSNSRAVGFSDALLLRQKNQAAKLYAPSTDYCWPPT